MKKILLTFFFILNLNANNKQIEDPIIWNKEEKPSPENNFQQNKKTYQTNHIAVGASIALIESILHYDEIIEKKELNDDFKYLDEFDNSIKK